MNQDQAYSTNVIRQRVESILRTLIGHLKKQGQTTNSELTNTQMTAANQPDGRLLCTVKGVCKGTQKLKLVLERHPTGSRAKMPCSVIRPLPSKVTPEEKGGNQIGLG